MAFVTIPPVLTSLRDDAISLSSELCGNTKKVVLLWMHEPPTRDATIIRQALTAEGVMDLKAIIEVICSRTPSQILHFKNPISTSEWFNCVLQIRGRFMINSQPLLSLLSQLLTS
ncbi:hypothetical protein ACFX2F_019500 [Malus domestica]